MREWLALLRCAMLRSMTVLTWLDLDSILLQVGFLYLPQTSMLSASPISTNARPGSYEMVIQGTPFRQYAAIAVADSSPQTIELADFYLCKEHGGHDVGQ